MQHWITCLAKHDPDDQDSYEQPPEITLWRAALWLLIHDAMDYHRLGYASKSAKEYTGEQAWDDLTGNAIMLTHLCNHTGDSPERIQDLFKQYVRKVPAARREI